ncbi:MAG: hypothetical protein Q9162_005797 [Coniocarpon cinnabarinum]
MKQFSKSASSSLSASASQTTGPDSAPSTREQNSSNGQSSEVRFSSSLDRSTASSSPLQKKRKLNSNARRAKLSFEEDDDEIEGAPQSTIAKKSKPGPAAPPKELSTDAGQSDRQTSKIGANKMTGLAPKAITKHSLQQEAEQIVALREEFRKQQEIVKEANIIVPFVFFEGTNTITSRVRLKKGDAIDALLSAVQKILVKEDYKRWVHLKLDDLMLVRNGVMIPHYLNIHYFILRGTRSSQGLLFDFSVEPPKTHEDDLPHSELEGADHDPNLTKVVDVKWYQSHKHIYPCNRWEWFDPHDPDKDYGYASTARRDAHGNSFFS